MPSKTLLSVVIGSAVLAFAGTSAAAENPPVDDAPFVPGEIIIKFTQQPGASALARVEAALGGDVTWRAPQHAPHYKDQPGVPHPLSYFRIAVLSAEADVWGLSDHVAALPGVDFASTNNTPEPTGVPNDPRFGDQWSHTKINTPAAWDINSGSTDIIIGVIDTGLRISHEDIAAHVWQNDDPPNGVDDDGNGFIDDTNGWDFVQNDNSIDDVFGHGTQVSGIIGSPINNATGIAGMGNLTIMTGKWWHTGGSDESVADSIFYCVDNGARVLNLSLSCGCELPMTETAVNYAHDNGVLVVCAAGNGGTDFPHFPASYPNAMSISAVDINDNLPSFSSFGEFLDVCAPSPDILAPSESGDSDYTETFRGTSAATPHVAGLAGLVLSVDPSLTHDEVRAAINDNATDLGAPGFDNFHGNGRIDCLATLTAVAPACSADLNGDNAIDPADLAVLLGAWGPNPGHPADLNGDSVVDAADLAVLLGSWGPC